jgi:hypothetical protein
MLLCQSSFLCEVPLFVENALF